MGKLITFDEASRLTDGQLKASSINIYAGKKIFTVHDRAGRKFFDEQQFLAELEAYRASLKRYGQAAKHEPAVDAPEGQVGAQSERQEVSPDWGVADDYPLEAQVDNLRRHLIVSWQENSTLKADLRILQKSVEKDVF
jgi:hypothetical protein